MVSGSSSMAARTGFIEPQLPLAYIRNLIYRVAIVTIEGRINTDEHSNESGVV